MTILSRCMTAKVWQLQKSSIRCASSIAHTVKVQHQIEEKKRTALLGGGLKRIESQHNRVSYLIWGSLRGSRMCLE